MVDRRIVERSVRVRGNSESPPLTSSSSSKAPAHSPPVLEPREPSHPRHFLLEDQRAAPLPLDLRQRPLRIGTLREIAALGASQVCQSRAATLTPTKQAIHLLCILLHLRLALCDSCGRLSLKEEHGSRPCCGTPDPREEGVGALAELCRQLLPNGLGGSHHGEHCLKAREAT